MLRLKQAEEFIWGSNQQRAFDHIKQCLVIAPMLIPPTLSRLLKLYISIAEDSLRSLLAQDSKDKIEQAIYYLSTLLNDAETRYTPIEKLCLLLFHACTKLDYYVLPREMLVVCKIDIVKYLLNWPYFKRD